MDEAAAAPVVGKPYQIAGRWYEPKEDPNYDEQGVASWYGRHFEGRRTANGERFNRTGLTAAHPTLPLPSYVRVTNLSNDRSIMVRVNDRGPFSRKRLIDVSERTAELLGFKGAGMASVRVQYVGRAKSDLNDKAFLLASYEGPPVEEAPPTVTLASATAEQPRSSRRARTKPTEVAAVVAAAPEPPRPIANQVAFVPEQADQDSPVTDAVGALSSSYPADARISMTFDLLSGPE